ncbi:hypothetical protein NRI63_004549 [Salmonella enterica]|nr:hypothetical protein [Salmonella enterica]
MARFIYTPEMKVWMQDNYLLRMDKLSVAFNAHFGTTRSSESLNGLRKRLKLRTGRRGCFTPGSIPANKGTRGVMNRWYSGSSPEYRQATLAMAQIKLAITRRQRDTK